MTSYIPHAGHFREVPLDNCDQWGQDLIHGLDVDLDSFGCRADGPVRNRSLRFLTGAKIITSWIFQLCEN